MPVRPVTEPDFSALKALNGLRCAVGITESADARGGPIGNAALLCLHEHGSPQKGIPARPLLEPAMERAGENIAGAAAEAVSAALSGSGARAALEPLGQAALAAVLAYYDAAPWAPNAASTVAQKGRSDPLVETGELRGAVGYEVRGRDF